MHDVPHRPATEYASAEPSWRPLAGGALPSFAEALGLAFRHRLDQRACDVARALLTGDLPSGARLIERELARSTDLVTAAGLIDRLAAALGDLWADDECSEDEILVALALVQIALHRQCSRRLPARGGGELGSVLVAPLPGERHLLRTALHAELLTRAGWAVRLLFPDSPSVLGRMVADERFALVCLSMSGVFRQEEKLPLLAATIASIRQMSVNPALRIVVGGRICAEHDVTAGVLAADAACTDSAEMPRAARLCCA